MCYSYRGREASEEARKMMRDKEDRRREMERAEKGTEKVAPKKERELVKKALRVKHSP